MRDIKTLFYNHILRRCTQAQMEFVMEDIYQNGFEHHMTDYQRHLDKVDNANREQLLLM